jgi:adenylylsulfate kinase
MYKKAREGAIKNWTGISSPYEAPLNPDIHIKNEGISLNEAADQIIEFLKKNKYIIESEK